MFHLRIKPKNVLQDYLNNVYQRVQVIKSNQVESVNYGIVNKFGTGPYDERYILLGRSNNPIVIVTTNQNTFMENFDKNKVDAEFTGQQNNNPTFPNEMNSSQESNGENRTKKHCNFCGKKFYHDHVGIPISMTIVGHKTFFQCVKIFHTFNCAYSYLITGNNIQVVNTPDVLYASSEYLLKYMFSLIHPGKKLKCNKERDLLDVNNGPLSSDEYENEQFIYKKLGNVVCTTAKIEYMQRSIK